MNTVEKKSYLIGRLFGSLCDMCGMYNMIKKNKYDDSKIHCMENKFIFTPESALHITLKRYDHIIRYARNKNMVSVTMYDKTFKELAENYESVGNIKISLLEFVRGKNDIANEIQIIRANNKKDNTNN